MAEALESLRVLLTRDRIGELCRYAAIGATCLSLKVVIVMALTDVLGLHYLVSLALCSLTLAVLGYLFNKLWTFRRHGTQVAPEFLRYAVTNLANIVGGIVLTAALVEILRLPYSVSIVVAALLLAPLTYVMHRSWAFGLAWRHGSRALACPAGPGQGALP